MQIVDLTEDDPRGVEQAAALLLEGFADTGSVAWQTREQALLSVEESLQEGRISRVAVDNSDGPLGWIGGISAYGGHAWELHRNLTSSWRNESGAAISHQATKTERDL